jgi:hypothetical protein
VPGHLDESWSDWVGGMTITVENEGYGVDVGQLGWGWQKINLGI